VSSVPPVSGLIGGRFVAVMSWRSYGGKSVLRSLLFRVPHRDHRENILVRYEQSKRGGDENYLVLDAPRFRVRNLDSNYPFICPTQINPVTRQSRDRCLRKTRTESIAFWCVASIRLSEGHFVPSF